jgi:hypothetical protein
VAETPLALSLTDQFGVEAVAIQRRREKPVTFCNQVRKNGSATVDPNAHLACYQLKAPKFQERTVQVNNQFGTAQILKVKKPETLCLPTQKKAVDGSATNLQPPAALDHYKCYKVEGTQGFTPRTVTLVDQFHTEQALVQKAVSLCAPVQKEDTPPGNVTTHLTCYKIKSTPAFTPRSVKACNQFGEVSFKASKPDTLCVPSTKKVL